MRALVKRAIEDAYFEGLAEAGIPPEELTDEDALSIVELNERQQEHILSFTADMRAARGDRDAEQAMVDRVELWAGSVNAAGQAAINSAQENQMVEFGGDDGEESCETCSRLKGQKHRRKWFVSKGLVPAPGNENFECQGFRCQHTLIPIGK